MLDHLPGLTMTSLVELAAEKSVERKGVPPMTRGEVEPLLHLLTGWSQTGVSIEKEFQFRSYLEGLDFAYSIGKTAEQQDHHPDILIKWRRVKLTTSTHSVKGLSLNDFILAARAELLFSKMSAKS